MGSPLGLSFKSADKGLQSRLKEGGTNTYRVVEGKAVESLFGGAQFSPYPEEEDLSTGSVKKMSTAGQVHKDESNDLSISGIIEYCSKHQRMKLDYAHFAYLKNVGVYPNNRLVIARRFAGAVGNDLTIPGGSPMATFVSWVPEDQDNFFSISFNEEWEEAAGSFEDILNEIGEDVKLSSDQKGLNAGGKMVSAAFNFVPMPSLMEGVQILIKDKLGLAGGGQGPGASPYGNPNLIREAKQRKVIPKGEAGSALTAKFSIDMVVEYEQKFINGVDPTLVYMDILQNALTFGTSDATFEYSGALARGATDIIGKLISGDIQGIVQAIYEFVDSLLTAIISVVNDLVDKLIDPPEDEDAEEDNRSDREKELEKGENYKKAIGDAFREYFKISIGTVISKYKIRLLGVANALSGSNSTPWHVTIGNPRKPIFSSGDMLCTEVNVILGKILAFNDLPQSIRIELKLENARNLGAQEIFNRFNTGRGRSYKRFQKSFVESDDAILDEVQKIEVQNANKEKNADTQQPAPKVENDPTKLANNGGAQQGDAKAPNKPNVSPQDRVLTGDGAKTNNTTDDYSLPADGKSSDWGESTYLISPPPPPKPIDQQGTASVDNSAKTSASEQSGNDPNTKTSGVAPANTNSNTVPNSTVPGVTQSASAIQQQQAAGVTGSAAPQPENLPAGSAEAEAYKRQATEALRASLGGPTASGASASSEPIPAQIASKEASAQTAAPQPAPTEDAKKEFDRNEKQKARFREASDYDLAQYYSNLQAQIASKEREIASYQKALSENPNFATEDPDEYQFILEDLKDLQDGRDAAIKASANIKEELKNRKK